MIDYLLTYIKQEFFQLIFHVTFKCNARCSFCFNWRELNKAEEKELSFEEIKRISESMPSFSWLLLSGGEPVLRKDLVDIIYLFYSTNKIKHVTLPTNGLLPEIIFEVTNEILKRCKELTLTLSFSLDAIGKEHDTLRGVPGCYEKVLESYFCLQSLRHNKNLNLKFNTVLSNQNYAKLESLIKKIRELKPDMHTIDFIRGDPKDKSINLPPEKELQKILKTIHENYKYYSGYSNLKSHSFILKHISHLVQNGYSSLFKEIITKKTQVVPCLAYKTSLVLYPYGDVSFCEPLKTFANLRNYNYDFARLINSKPAKIQKQSIINKKCYCYHPCYQYLNVLFSPMKLIKEEIKNVL